MREVESRISALVKAQFPGFYQDDQARIVDFVKAYYEWMEQSSQAAGAARRIMQYRDIDTTLSEFYKHFRAKYLENFPDTSSATTPFLVKNALDIYKAKGTEEGIKLLLQILYNEESTVYLPGSDVFKASDGTWDVPKYLELSQSTRTASYLNKEILGERSGARAFAESLVTRRIKGKYIDILYISNVNGRFITGERIVEISNTVNTNAPLTVGSLSYIEILDGGQNLAVGDLLDINSEAGKQGVARVTEISSETGIVKFSLNDGGFGYSTSANVIVSDKVLNVNNVINANTLLRGPDYSLDYTFLETVTQSIYRYGVTGSTNNSILTANTLVTVYYPNNGVKATARIISFAESNTSAGYLKLYPLTGSGSIIVGDDIYLPSNTMGLAVANVLNSTATGKVIGAHTVPNSTPLSIGLTGVVNEFLASNVAPVIGSTSNTYSYIQTIGSGEGADFVVSLLSEEEDVILNTDLLAGNNVGLVPYMNIMINGTGSNSTIYQNTFNALTGVSNTNDTIALGNAIKYFAVGDTVRYTVAAGNTAIGGLTNNTVYYVKTSNTTAITLSTTAGGSTINLTSGVSETGHTITTTYWAGYGFPKRSSIGLRGGTILDALTFVNATVGVIEEIAGIDRGQDYTQDPFVLVKEEYVYPLDKRDYILRVANVAGAAYVNGEIVEQTFQTPMTVLATTNFTGNTAPELGERVIQANSTSSNASSGVVYRYGTSGGFVTSITITDVTGQGFVSNTAYPITTETSNATANVTATSLITTSTSARGIIKNLANSTYFEIKRLSLANNFVANATLLGQTSGATSQIVDIYVDKYVNLEADRLTVSGVNANVTANVQVANNVATNLEVVVSGFGYVNDETLTLSKPDFSYVVTGKANVHYSGVGAGFFSSTKGFVSEDKFVHDNFYYQEYSYEVRTKIPFTKYQPVLNRIMHVAGTQSFGKSVSATTANAEIAVGARANSSVTLTLSYSNAYAGSNSLVFATGDTVYQNTGSTNTFIGSVSSPIFVSLKTYPKENQVVEGTTIYYPRADNWEMKGDVSKIVVNEAANTSTLYLVNVTGVFPDNLHMEHYDSSNQIRSVWSIQTLNTVDVDVVSGNVSTTVPIRFGTKQANVSHVTYRFI